MLFTEEVVRLLIDNREKGTFSSENIYVFASGSGESRMKGCVMLHAISKKIDLDKTKSITPTRAKKYLATVLQLLDINAAELTWVTNHMTHTENLHFS